MHQDRVHADKTHEHNVADDLFAHLLVDHGMAAVFDDNGGAVEFFDVRQGFNKDLCRVVAKFHCS